MAFWFTNCFHAQPKHIQGADDIAPSLTAQELESFFTPYDLRRLESYASNIVDYHIIIDLVPTLARLYFMDRIPISMSFTQAATLAAMGLQHKSLDKLSVSLSTPGTTCVASFQ